MRFGDADHFHVQRHIGDPRAHRGAFGLSLHVSADMWACKEFRRGREKTARRTALSYNDWMPAFFRRFSARYGAAATFDPSAH